MNLGWFNVVIHLNGSILSANFYLIQKLPYPYGSINKGYLVELVTIIPFWIDNSSLGNPYKFHSPTVASSTKNYVKFNPGVTGTPLLF